MSSAQVQLPTPWYPLPYNRMAGAFVADHARLVSRLVERVEVVHGIEWPGGTPDVVAGLREHVDGLLRAASLEAPDGPVPLTRVPVMITAGLTVPQRGEALVRDIGTAVGSLGAPLVHGHVGYLGGLVAARLAEPGARVFVTEHSSGLGSVLDDPQGREQYLEVLERAERVLCVSGVLREQVLAAFPDRAGRVDVLPNPVDVEAIPTRGSLPERLLRWVFVGNLGAHKGVERLVRAWCRVAREEPGLTLTMYGDGPLRPLLEQLAVEAGVRDRLDLRGVLPHRELVTELREHDLLLAPSVFETFHLAVLEAVCAGLPVIVTRSGGPQETLAGLEHKVGRFVDVADDPDELVDAYRDLSGALDTLDLPGARAELTDRYGTEAIAARLGELYGVPAGRKIPDRPPGTCPPARVVLLAAAANRRYDVHAAMDALAGSGADVVLAARDPELVARAEAQGWDVVAPYLATRVPAAPAPTRAQRLLRQAPEAPPNPFGLRGRPDEVVVATDCHSAQHALALQRSLPGLRLACQLPLAP